MKYEIIKKSQPTQCVGYTINIKMPEERLKIFDVWAKFNADRNKIPHATGVSYGISDFTGEKVKYSAVMEVTSVDKIPQGMEVVTLTPHSYAQFLHEGTVQEIGNTCQKIYEELPKTNLQPAGPLVEVYSKNFTGRGIEQVPILLTLAN
jgi:predicted transcriptional regulator YdeE